MDIKWFRNKRVTVMGLGLHGGGLGVAKWLLKHGARIIVTDMKTAAELAPSVAALTREYARLKRTGFRPHRPIFHLGGHHEADFISTDLVIKNPGVRRDNRFLSLAFVKNVPVDTDVGLFFRLCPFPVAAVTGTKGKTTTTTLLADICRRHDQRTVVGGNIRVSVLDSLDHLLAMSRRRRLIPPPVVLELSSWQVEGLEQHRLSPHVAVITNIKEDHLNTYRDIDDYARAKELIVTSQKTGDVAVLNHDDARVRAMGERLLEKRAAGPKVIWFSGHPMRSGEGCSVVAGFVVFSVGGKLRRIFPVSSIKLLGQHNVANVLAATAAAMALDVPAKTIAATVRAFRGVPNRLEEIAVKGGVTYINDTTATAPDAAIAALKALGGKKKRIILLAGGADKALRFDDWAKEAKRYAKAIVFFDGTATPKMVAALNAVRAKTPYLVAGSMNDALAAARVCASRGDIVLLSPGCASFGMFINEFDRGEQFVRGVKGKK
ncbi:MAG: UDP-N-acetylmuramoyl-L-alanine--D-glutamate ligase [Patescibacteria group bacterium]|nr:UDP-N-acetylmuramoyl-L-alanine--D-glutamate ligase [Patescibacteria group bacterium]